MSKYLHSIAALGVRKIFGLSLGIVLALVILIFFNLDPSNPAVTRCAAVAVLMACWWLTEAIPIAATALVPVVLFPLLGVSSGKTVAGAYFNNIIFLFLGGFMVAIAMQRWGLHRRIAIRIITLIGLSPNRIVFGFMAATAFLSMWISNTATAMMMVPIALAIITRLEDTGDKEPARKLSVPLLIGIAYAASIGGIATLIGTPPNLAFSRIFKISFPNAPDISFAQWMLFGVPFAVVFLVIAWRVLVRVFLKEGIEYSSKETLLSEDARAMGKMSFEEKIIAICFGALAFLWIFRQDIPIGSFVIPGWSGLLPEASFIDDGTVAISVALLLFLIPSKNEPGRRILRWRDAVALPWGIVILFGGGFALATGFKDSGLSVWLGSQMSGLGHFPPILIIAVIGLSMTFLTELTSNTATTQMILPILASLGVAMHVNPLLLMIPATISASCAFMLPVATPPNAIIFGTDRVTIGQMAKSGIILNLIGVVLVTVAVYFLGSAVFGISAAQYPVWG